MRILFQGDSITDTARDRSDYHNLGEGYPFYAAAEIASKYPAEDFEFINLGIGGNKTIDLVERWKSDCIDLDPDFVSILIGMNDVWHYADANDRLDDAIFESNYRTILERTKNETSAKIMMLEPFLLPDDEKPFRYDLNPKIDIVRKLAREYADVYVPLDGVFAAACASAERVYWSEDAVHPTTAGARLIARMYVDAFDRIYPTLKSAK